MIIGAGVVGCHLGARLGNQEIWERSAHAFEKPCGGLLSRELEQLGIDFEDSVLNRVRGARLFAGKESVEIARKDFQAYVLDRFSFQKALMEEAESAGCKILWGKAWNGEDADFVLAADGAGSSVGRAQGIRRDYIFTYQVEAKLKGDADFVELHFGDFAPGFFGWIVPVDGKNARIGIGCDRGNPKSCFDLFRKKFDIGKTEKVQSAIIPVFDPKTKTVFGNSALVGDAAAQVKATTGGGIVYGCKCAQVLAEAVEKGDVGFYEKEWRRLYGRELQTHLRIRKFLDRVNYEKLLRYIKEERLDELIAEKGDMDKTGWTKELVKRGIWKLPGLFI